MFIIHVKKKFLFFFKANVLHLFQNLLVLIILRNFYNKISQPRKQNLLTKKGNNKRHLAN